jgi:hypothetical protein
MRAAILSFVLCFAALGVSVALARPLGGAPPGSEAAKSATIRALLRNAPPVDVGPFVTEDGGAAYGPPEWIAWCSRFMSDFRAQRDIQFVEPVAQSQRYDDPVFKVWQNQCPQLAFNARTGNDLYAEIPGPRGEWIKSLPPHMPDGSRRFDLQYGTRDFKFFVGDFDNDPYDAGTAETIFYADSYYSYLELVGRDERFALAYPPLDRNWNELMPPHEVPETLERQLHAEYRLVSPESCESAPLFSPISRYDGPRLIWHRGPRLMINGLISYQGQYYLFDLMIGSREEGESDSDFDLMLKWIKPTDPHLNISIGYFGPTECRFQ